MSSWIHSYLSALWGMTLEMAPWLFLGFALAGLLRAVLPAKMAQKYLGAGDSWAPTKAALLGMPMPLCSCSVIPVAAHLRKSGAGDKASLSFLTATPTNGLDSMLPTLAVLGPGFMVLRPLFAFFSALGVSLAVPENSQGQSETIDSGPPLGFWTRLKNGMDYAFGDLVRDTRKWILLGLLLAALIEVLLPAQWVASLGGLGSYALVMAIAIPMYVCSTGSLPIAAALMGKGLSAGAGFLFITLGPATSTATLAFVFGTYGSRTGWRWILTLAGMALGVALMMDYVLPAHWFVLPGMDPAHQHGESLWSALGTMLFLAVLAKSYLGPLRHSHVHPNTKENAMIHEFVVPDMSCGNCARSIENRMAEKGWRLCAKNLETKAIQIESDADRSEISEVLTQAGFKPKT